MCYGKHGNPNDLDFGNFSVLAVGDFYQLDPVGQSPLFVKSYSNAKCPSDLAPNVWDKFLFHELTQVTRQKDLEFSNMLNIVQVSMPEENSQVDCILKARELNMIHIDDVTICGIVLCKNNWLYNIEIVCFFLPYTCKDNYLYFFIDYLLAYLR